MNCTNCGAPSTIQDDPSWNCTYCGTSNYNEQYAKQYLKGINLAKAESNYKLGIANFEGGRFGKAADCFEDAIKSNEKNGDAWIYLAITLSKETTGSSIERDIAQTNICLENGKKYCKKKELVEAGNQLTSEAYYQKIASILIERISEANKAYNAFASTNRPLALEKMNAQYQRAIAYYSLTTNLILHPPLLSAIVLLIMNEVAGRYQGNQKAEISNSVSSSLEKISIDHESVIPVAKQYLIDKRILSPPKPTGKSSSAGFLSSFGNLLWLISGLILLSLVFKILAVFFFWSKPLYGFFNRLAKGCFFPF